MRYFASIAVVSFAAVIFNVGAALAQFRDQSGCDRFNFDRDVCVAAESQPPSASPRMTEGKVKQDVKERDRMNQQEHSDRKTGRDHADRTSGANGQDREVERPHGTRE